MNRIAANCSGHRYDGHRVSRTETPFCELDSRGACTNIWHDHPKPTAPARPARRRIRQLLKLAR